MLWSVSPLVLFLPPSAVLLVVLPHAALPPVANEPSSNMPIGLAGRHRNQLQRLPCYRHILCSAAGDDRCADAVLVCPCAGYILKVLLASWRNGIMLVHSSLRYNDMNNNIQVRVSLVLFAQLCEGEQPHILVVHASL